MFQNQPFVLKSIWEFYSFEFDSVKAYQFFIVLDITSKDHIHKSTPNPLLNYPILHLTQILSKFDLWSKYSSCYLKVSDTISFFIDLSITMEIDHYNTITIHLKMLVEVMSFDS